MIAEPYANIDFYKSISNWKIEILISLNENVIFIPVRTGVLFFTGGPANGKLVNNHVLQFKVRI